MEFDRPIQLILEMHNNYVANDCHPGPAATILILVSAYVDDPEIASELRDQLHFPAVDAAIERTVGSLPIGEEIRYTWSVDGADPSWVSYLVSGDNSPGAHFPRGLVWHNETHLYRAMGTIETNTPGAQPYASRADFQAPSVMAQYPLPTDGAFTTLVRDSTLPMNVEIFEKMDCS